MKFGRKNKKLKWINTRFAKKHKKRQAIKLAMTFSCLLSSNAKIKLIASQDVIGEKANIEKKLAVANAVIDTYKGLIRINDNINN